MGEFKELTSIDMLKNFIYNNPLTFLFISQPNCSVCHGLFPQVNELMTHYPKIKLGHVNAEQVKEVASLFSVFTVPVLLFFVDGKEYIREARIVHLDQLDEKINKIYKNVCS
ncbi:thioredoxin family protein [Virgibacillus sp. FSP13]